jgi:surfeit locus 1 family protein
VKGLRFWLVTLAAAVGLCATFALGVWQLGRAHQKEALAAAIAAGRTQPPLPHDALLGPDAASRLHSPVRLRGQWAADRTVFLDNRQMAGRVGFYVVTPLRLEGSDAAVLVQRGWAPRNFAERGRLPEVQTPPGPVEVVGRIAPPPAKLYEFAGAAAGPIRQNLDLPAFAAETGLKLLPLSVQETSPASQGLLRDWPVAGSGPEKNYGYAVQWWALAALIAILYVWFQFIQPRRRARAP